MTDKMRKFLETASEDPALIEKMRQAETQEALIALAAEIGFTLTEEDLKEDLFEGAISDDEMDAVTGGSGCGCYGLGAGNQAGSMEQWCECVMFGTGWETDAEQEIRCICASVGEGAAGS